MHAKRFLPIGTRWCSGESSKCGIGNLASYARHAEEVGLESVWVGDHLIPVVPYLDSTLVLATAAAATKHIKVGFAVMILALRPVAWAAKQIATLQHLSGDRVLLGIGSGGDVYGDAAWKVVGNTYEVCLCSQKSHP